MLRRCARLSHARRNCSSASAVAASASCFSSALIAKRLQMTERNQSISANVRKCSISDGYRNPLGARMQIRNSRALEGRASVSLLFLLRAERSVRNGIMVGSGLTTVGTKRLADSHFDTCRITAAQILSINSSRRHFDTCGITVAYTQSITQSELYLALFTFMMADAGSRQILATGILSNINRLAFRRRRIRYLRWGVPGRDAAASSSGRAKMSSASSGECSLYVVID